MANQMSGLFQKLMQNPKMASVVSQMFNSMGKEGQTAFLNRPKIAQAMKIGVDGSTGVEGILQQENPGASIAQALAGDDGGDGDPGDLGALAFGAAKAHPFKTAGLIGMGAGNIGGLTDNDKFGGQLAGLGLGGLGAHLLAQGNPYLQAVMTMGGGNLGALFDKLRARKEQEEMYGGR